MGERTVNWLVYTCLIGLIPVIARFLLWAMSSSNVEPLAISDWVSFGLVLHTVNISEISRTRHADPRWTSVHNGVSIIFLVLYGLILFTTIVPTTSMNPRALLFATIGLSAASFFLSLAVLRGVQEVEKRASNA